MRFFMEEILEDERVIQELHKDSELLEKGKTIADYIMKHHDYPNIEAGMLPIYVLGYLADFVLERNLERGISREITVQTLKDVNVWIENYEKQYGDIGLAEFHWLIFHYTSRLFRLGRLQFQLMVADAAIPTGDFVIETHIPQGDPLNIEQCMLSFGMATKFFETYFPEYKADYFMCHSWLLNPRISDVLNESSNIVRFMSLWNKYDIPSDDSAQAIERVFGFGFKQEELAFAPENTTLQKALKEYLLSGKALDITAGYMRRW